MDKDKKQLTLVAFENDWCAQCYTQKPIIQALAKKYADRLAVKIVNIEEHPELARQYRLYTAPSIAVLVNGQLVERITRFIDLEQLETLIRYYL